MSDDKIIRLVPASGTATAEGAAASALVVDFLREWADAIENGNERAHKAVLVMYENCGGGPFRIASRGCNVSAIERAGIMAMAQDDFCTADG